MALSKIVFMGTPEFAVPSLRALVKSGRYIITVVTQPDRPAGRGRKLRASPVKEAALELGLTVIQPASMRSAEAVAELAALSPDVIVVAAYGQILRQNVLELPRRGVVGVHPSLLPRHRGAAPVAATILAGDAVTGVSIFLLDAGVDSGPLLAQESIPVDAQDTTGTLTTKLAELGAELLVRTLPAWLAAAIEPQPQSHDLATYAPMIKREDSILDWRLPAEVLWRQVRAYNPWPGALTYLDGEALHIWEAWPLPPEQAGLPPAQEPGTIIPLSPQIHALLPPLAAWPTFGVVTGSGILAVLQVQRAGRRAMSAAEFLRGQRELWGRRLGA